MILPRLALFRSDRMNINHMVVVDGEVMKPLCIRLPIKHGHVLGSDGILTCEHCRSRGWTKSLGPIGAPVDTDAFGRYKPREYKVS